MFPLLAVESSEFSPSIITIPRLHHAECVKYCVRTRLHAAAPYVPVMESSNVLPVIYHQLWEISNTPLPLLGICCYCYMQIAFLFWEAEGTYEAIRSPPCSFMSQVTVSHFHSYLHQPLWLYSRNKAICFDSDEGQRAVDKIFTLLRVREFWDVWGWRRL